MSNSTSNDGTLATLAEAPTSRRNFLRSASLTAVGGALVACGTGAGAAAASAKQTAGVAQAGNPKPGATGGTMGATLRLVEQLGGKVVGVAFMIELAFLHGRDKLKNYPVHSLIGYD